VKTWSFGWLATATAVLSLLAPDYAAPARPALDRLPRLVLWAWERPEDLRAAGDEVAVAFLASTVTIAGERFSVQPRRQPLRVASGAPLVAVTRIEVRRSIPPSLSADDIDALASVVAKTAAMPRVVGVQVDFDAAASERPLYRRLLAGLRAQLAPSIPLSITALASWCADDRWLDGLPIDEAVPMLFRMGPANEPFRDMALRRDAAHGICRASIGLSVDEPLPVRTRGRRVYVFNPRSWSPLSIEEARRRPGP